MKGVIISWMYFYSKNIMICVFVLYIKHTVKPHHSQNQLVKLHVSAVYSISKSLLSKKDVLNHEYNRKNISVE